MHSTLKSQYDKHYNLLITGNQQGKPAVNDAVIRIFPFSNVKESKERARCLWNSFFLPSFNSMKQV